LAFDSGIRNALEFVGNGDTVPTYQRSSRVAHGSGGGCGERVLCWQGVGAPAAHSAAAAPVPTPRGAPGSFVFRPCAHLARRDGAAKGRGSCRGAES
jgi:hypothetical protein